MCAAEQPHATRDRASNAVRVGALSLAGEFDLTPMAIRPDLTALARRPLPRSRTFSNHADVDVPVTDTALDPGLAAEVGSAGPRVVWA